MSMSGSDSVGGKVLTSTVIAPDHGLRTGLLHLHCRLCINAVFEPLATMRTKSPAKNWSFMQNQSFSSGFDVSINYN